MADLWERIERVRRDIFFTGGAATPAMSSMNTTIDRLALALDQLVTELENLNRVRNLRRTK